MKNLYIIGVLSLLLLSCSTEFSNYTKDGKNDLEYNDLRGAVKAVSIYSRDSVLLNIVTYNQWGFYEENKSYSRGIFLDGVLQNVRNFIYDENGNLLKKIDRNEVNNMTTVTSYAYDKYNNLIKEWWEIDKEIKTFSKKEVVKISEKTVKTVYEYVYEDGMKVKETIHDKVSSENGISLVNLFDQDGNIIESYTLDANGKVITVKFSKYDKHHNRTSFVIKDNFGHMMDSTVYVYTAKPIHGVYKKAFVTSTHSIFSKTENKNSKATYTYNSQGDVVSQIIERYNADGSFYNRKIFEIKYEYDNQGNWISKEMYVKTIDANQKISIDNSIGYNRLIEYY